MPFSDNAPPEPALVPVINLADAQGRREAWDRPAWAIYLWAIIEALFLINPLQPSSQIRVIVLRLFGATIGTGVILRPRLRVKFPWKLTVGNGSWIGEDVWIHNQADVAMGANAVISQGSFVTTGSHAYATDMSLVTKPVVIHDGAWITSRCIVLAGSRIGTSALILPGTTVRGDVPPATIYGNPQGTVMKNRFP